MWYYATHSDGREGMIPANYVKEGAPSSNNVPSSGNIHSEKPAINANKKEVKLQAMPYVF